MTTPSKTGGTRPRTPDDIAALCRIEFETFGAKLHFIPTYCPHLDPAERLWGLMHKHVTHNRCHATFADFKAATLTFLREEVPRKWGVYCDQVTDNFRIISPKDFRVLR